MDLRFLEITMTPSQYLTDEAFHFLCIDLSPFKISK